MLDPSFVTGAPNWADLGTPDVDAATTFYQGLFGWELVRGGPETGGYGMYQLRGRTVAGVMAVAEDQGTPAWSVYFQTPDADATARTVEKAGGTAAFPPMDVLDYGRMGGFTDNGGAYFGVWQPGTNTGLGMIMEPGSLIWSELYTPDVPAAAAFFHTVFGWQTDDMAFPGGSYTMVRPAGTTAPTPPSEDSCPSTTYPARPRRARTGCRTSPSTTATPRSPRWSGWAAR